MAVPARFPFGSLFCSSSRNAQHGLWSLSPANFHDVRRRYLSRTLIVETTYTLSVAQSPLSQIS